MYYVIIDFTDDDDDDDGHMPLRQWKKGVSRKLVMRRQILLIDFCTSE